MASGQKKNIAQGLMQSLSLHNNIEKLSLLFSFNYKLLMSQEIPEETDIIDFYIDLTEAILYFVKP